MRVREMISAAAMIASLAVSTAASAQDFNGANFEINRDRVRYGTIGTCAKSTTFLVPTTYLYVTIRNQIKAGGGISGVGAKARMFVEGLRKSELQQLAAQVTQQVVDSLRGAGYQVLTFDDVRGDVADKARMQPNPRYGVPTHEWRAFPGMDFVVTTPSDEQTLDYGLMGPGANYTKAAQRTGATMLLIEMFFTMPQLGASAGTTEVLNWRSSHANISFNPAMHLAGINVYGGTAKGGWCSILVPEHGVRTPAPHVGEFKELSVRDEDYGEWGFKYGDYAFVLDNQAFDTGVLASGRSLAKLITDTMVSKR